MQWRWAGLRNNFVLGLTVTTSLGGWLFFVLWWGRWRGILEVCGWKVEHGVWKVERFPREVESFELEVECVGSKVEFFE